MLNFRNTSFVFFFILSGMLLVNLFKEISWLWFVLPITGYSISLFYGSYCVGSNFYMNVLCQSVTNEKIIALTFDDGPVEGNTARILDILKANDIKATFFCIGNRIEGNSDLIKRIINEGHIIGNHSYSHHFFFDLKSRKNMAEELKSTNEIVKNITGKRMKLFRPPYGVTNPNLAKAVKEMDLYSVGWSLRSMDTVANDEIRYLDKLLNIVKPGDIILLHDTADITISILQRFIDSIKGQGYRIIGVDKLLNINAYV